LQQTPSVQYPDAHTAPEEQASPFWSLASQTSPLQYWSAWQLFTSGGQSGALPLQVSGVESQVPLASRQTCPETYSSGGQSAEEPEQASGASHGPAGGRQTKGLVTVEVLYLSTGQIFDTPSQLSGASQGPATTRQMVPKGRTSSAQSGSRPLQ
jgi:hypothetical protein